MRIFLIGMPGSGKTTIASKLAKDINYTYVDLDGMIEKNAHLFIEEIFEKYGEAGLRSLVFWRLFGQALVEGLPSLL